ncbi:MAG: TIGR04283 family arsenosugar biosynthesis glycosyltransferase [Pseudomonadota bacterium]
MISVIIPTLDAAARIGPCLYALSPAIIDPVLSEVIFADGGSDDDIEEIAEATGARLVRADRGRGAQLAAGAEAARGDWFLFLHADTVLSEDWVEVARAHIEQGPERAGYFRLAFAAKGFGPRLVAGWGNLRSRLFGLPFGDQALLIHRGLYQRVGGFQRIPLMEDVAIARALSGRLTSLPATATTDFERYQRQGWVKRGAANLWLQARYFAGASPEALADEYRR